MAEFDRKDLSQAADVRRHPFPSSKTTVLFEFFIWTPIFAVIGGIVGLVAARFPRTDEREILKDPRSRPKAIARYRSGGYPTYIRRLEWLSGWANDFYGQPYVSWQSFARCLQLAFLYPLVALILGWAFFDAGEVGGFNDSGRRSAHSPTGSEPTNALLLFSWAVAYWNQKHDVIGETSVALVDRMLPAANRTSFLTKVVRPVAD